MPLVPTSGKSASFAIGTVIYHHKGWAVNASGSEGATNNTQDAGYTNRIVTLRDAEITLDLDWDAGANLMAATPTLYPGTIVTGLKCFLDAPGSSGVYWLFPSAVVMTTPMQAKVGDVIKWTVTLKNKGTFTPPTGTFTPSAFGAADPSLT